MANKLVCAAILLASLGGVYSIAAEITDPDGLDRVVTDAMSKSKSIDKSKSIEASLVKEYSEKLPKEGMWSAFKVTSNMIKMQDREYEGNVKIEVDINHESLKNVDKGEKGILMLH